MASSAVLPGSSAGCCFPLFAAPYISQNAFTTFVKGSGSGGMIDLKMIAGSILFPPWWPSLAGALSGLAGGAAVTGGGDQL